MKQGWYGLLVVTGVAAVMTPAIVLAAGGGDGHGFNAVVRSIETRYHAHATKIPFMGLVSLIAGTATHGGVRGLHVAEIENLTEPVDGAELNELVSQRVGQGWQRMIRETSRNGGEQTLIYVRPEGDRMGLLVVDLDGHEMDVVQVSVDPAHLDDDIGQYRHHHRTAQDGDKQDESGGLDKPSKTDTHDEAESN